MNLSACRKLRRRTWRAWLLVWLPPMIAGVAVRFWLTEPLPGCDGPADWLLHRRVPPPEPHWIEF